MKYEVVDMIDTYTKKVTGQGIKATSTDGLIFWIPQDPANSDYQAYLAWVAENNKEDLV
jgi:hypothetical protein